MRLSISKYAGLIAVGLLAMPSIVQAHEDVCETLLTVRDSTPVRAHLSAKIDPLLKRFGQVKSIIYVEDNFAVEVHSKNEYRGFLALDAATIPGQVKLYISSTGSRIGGPAPVQDWNLFTVNLREGLERTRAFDMVAHLGDWEIQSPDQVAIQAINVLTAMSMVPYVRHVIVNVPILRSSIENEMRKELEAVSDLQRANRSDLEILHAMNLPHLQLLTKYLPVKIVKVKFNLPEDLEAREIESHEHYADVYLELLGKS